MLEKVQPKTKILASQYNDLVAAVQGPINASESIPFTQTKNGIVLNGGSTSYAAKPPAKVPTALEVLVTNGRLTSAYDGYVAGGNAQAQGDANRFSGVLLNLGEGSNIMNTICWSTFRQGRAEVPMICIIDPTSQGAKLVPLNLAAMRENPSGQWPLCEVSQNAGIAVVQITKASSQSIVGDILAIAGNWKKLGATSGESVSPLTTADLGNIVANISTYSTATEARVLRMTSLWLGQPWLASGVQNVPQVAYTVGIQDIFPQPDIYPPTESLNCEKLSTWLSSITYVPRQQLGFDPLFSTFVYTLNNFDKLSSTYDDIDELKTAPDLITQLPTTNEISAFDLLLRHKKPHPDNYAGQAAACLEYVNLEGFLDNLSSNVDSNITALQLSSVQEGTWTDPDTGKDVKYHELFNFDQSELTDFQISDDCDIVIRDYTRSRVPAGAAVNYVKLSTFLSGISSTDVDTWATQGAQRSIDWNTTNNKKYLQLYNFDSNSYDDALRVNLAYGQHRYATKDGSGEYPDPYVEFVVRDRSGNRMVKYDALDIYAPPISASDITDLCSVISTIVDHECSCDLGPLSAKVDQLSSSLSNYWKVGGTYSDNCYGQSIGDDSQNPQIDLNNGQLLYSNELDPTVDWHNGYLSWNNAELRLDWGDCITYDKSQGQAIDWDYRHLYDAAGNVAVRWNNRTLHDSNQLGALDWDNRTLYDSNLHIVADWERQQLLDSNTTTAVDWGSRYLNDSNQNTTLNWQQKTLEGNWAVNGNLSVEQGATLTIGSTTITEAQLQQLLALLQVVPNALQGV